MPTHYNTFAKRAEEKEAGSSPSGDVQHLHSTSKPYDKAKLLADDGHERRTSSQDMSECEILSALQSTTLDIEYYILQATMLLVYQAHQYADHKSKISTLSFLEPEDEKSHGKAPQYGMKENKILRKGCRAVQLAMHKTLFMEHRDICGPAIQYWPTKQPPSLHVCLYCMYWHANKHRCCVEYKISDLHGYSYMAS